MRDFPHHPFEDTDHEQRSAFVCRSHLEQPSGSGRGRVRVEVLDRDERRALIEVPSRMGTEVATVDLSELR